MVDRSARNQAAAAIEAYLDDRITAFEFDERMGIDTQDLLVKEVAGLAWFHYDDCTDHKVVLTEEEWNMFQRLLLLLRSDVEAAPCFKVPRRWDWDQRLASLACVLYAALAWNVGWNGWLFVLALPFGPLAYWIHSHRLRTAPVLSAQALARFPFPSWGELRQVRRRTPAFAKRRYRREISGRAVREGMGWDAWRGVLECLGWTFLAPAVLLSQGFPTRREEGLPLALRLP